jgi:hypothetical protein
VRVRFQYATRRSRRISSHSGGPIGGLIERGDIHRAMQANPDLFGGAAVETLNPDELADTVWRLYADRQDAEAVVNTLRV